MAKRLERTLIEMARASIIEGGIDDSIWPEVILAMTYVKNLRPEKALQGLSPHQELFKTLPKLAHLRVLGSTVYVLIHEEEREFRSEKIVPRALKGKPVGFDGHTIYCVHIEKQNRVIGVKYLRIFDATGITIPLEGERHTHHNRGNLIVASCGPKGQKHRGGPKVQRHRGRIITWQRPKGRRQQGCRLNGQKH